MSMEKRIASSSLVVDPAARELQSILEKCTNSLNISDSIFYYNFPIFRDESNHLYRSKVLLATKSHGLYVFAPVVEVDRDTLNFNIADQELIQLDTILYGKFLRSKTLRKSKREIALSVNSAIVCLNSDTGFENVNTDTPILHEDQDVQKLINDNAQDLLTDEQWEDLISLLEGTKALSRQDDRNIAELPATSKAYALAKMEEKIATFDIDQRRAAINIVNGPQRIRGIAGSGKTIVLAMRAAHLHLDNPDSLILITFWTKSLYDLIKQLITKFYRQFNDQDPDWEKLHILHAWGGRSTSGVYFNACQDNGIRPKAFREIVPVNNRTKFEQVCEELLVIKQIQQKYDYILIDEGQDLPASFYKLCFSICKGEDYDRNIVWAYDELQTIMDVKPQDVSKTFGVDINNNPIMDLDRASQNISKGLFSHDVVLKRSYRNPPEILMCAHALGMGLYSDQPVQMLEGKSHWEDLGYEITQGECKKGVNIKISRPAIHSPLNLSDYESRNEIIKYGQFDNFESEIEWIVNEVKEFISEGLKPHDILIISLDDRHAKSYFIEIGNKLSEIDISINNLQNAAFTVPKFFVENHVSVSTVYKAKGNEAAVVLVVGVDAISIYLKDRRSRNMLFTAFTRSRAWLRVSGIAPHATDVMNEMEKAIQNFPEFSFVYPDPAEIEMVQRDLSEKSVNLSKMQQLMLDLNMTEDDLDLLKEKIQQDAIKKS